MKRLITALILATVLMAGVAYANSLMLLMGVGGGAASVPATYEAFQVTDNGGEDFNVTDGGGEAFNIIQ